jgi:hypothetical protein
MNVKPPLTHEGTVMDNEPIQRRKLPVVVLAVWGVIWGLMCGVMLLSAVLGLVCFMVGAISFLVGRWSLEMHLGGTLMQTTAQKALFTCAGAALCVIGIGFWWLRQRGYIVGAVVLYAAFVVLVLALPWITGSSHLISIGWATN